MATTQDYINQLKIDKQNLVSMLNNMGVEATNNETFTSLTPKVGKIVTDPILQDKSIEITENGTTNVVADEGYDGLNNVEVITNVSGGETPEKGFVVTEWDNEGYALAIQVFGLETIDSFCFGMYERTSNTNGSYLTRRLKKIILPETVTKIAQCFYGMTTLEYVNLPNNLVEIGVQTFYCCSKLSNIKRFPDSLREVWNAAFRQCYLLTQLSMKNVTILASASNANSIFYNCTGLKAVWIGSSISGTNANFGRYVFSGCTNLKKIFIDLPRATVEAFANYSYAFSNSTVTTDVIVCNDDDDFMTQDEFDAIDWATYTE